MYVRHVCFSISIGAISGLATPYVVFLLSKDKYLSIRERTYFAQVNYVYTSSLLYLITHKANKSDISEQL